jgi:hypothetical protein
MFVEQMNAPFRHMRQFSTLWDFFCSEFSIAFWAIFKTHLLAIA